MSEYGRDNPSPATTLYVLIPPSPMFAAHWSLFIPDILPYDVVTRRHEESNHGRRIHVSGDRLNGFTLEIIRDYDLKKHTSVGSRRFAIGTIAARYLQATRLANSKDCQSKDDDEGGGWIDNVPIDELEELVVAVEAPGPSLNSTSSGAPRKKLTVVKDCQWWVKEVVRKLSDSGVRQMLSKEDHSVVIARLPAH